MSGVDERSLRSEISSTPTPVSAGRVAAWATTASICWSAMARFEGLRSTPKISVRGGSSASRATGSSAA